MDKRDVVCKLIPWGGGGWDKFQNNVLHTNERLNITISSVMESNWGYSAMHPGNALRDLVKYSGDPIMCYRYTYSNMQSSEEVIDKQEIRKVKCSKKNDIFNRQNNIINHVFTHKCSKSCVKEIELSIFNPSKYRKKDLARLTNSNGTPIINIS